MEAYPGHLIFSFPPGTSNAAGGRLRTPTPQYSAFDQSQPPSPSHGPTECRDRARNAPSVFPLVSDSDCLHPPHSTHAPPSRYHTQARPPVTTQISLSTVTVFATLGPAAAATGWTARPTLQRFFNAGEDARTYGASGRKAYKGSERGGFVVNL